MDAKKAVKILYLHNKWRKGRLNVGMQHPKDVSDAIDFAVKFINNK